VVALANSKRFVVRREGIELGRWGEELDGSARRMDPRTLVREIASLGLANAALIDCTAASSIVDAYPEFVKANLHIVTPNKRANVLPWPRYNALREVLAARQKQFLYETNVGAGLPIMSTLGDLIATGDVITKVEGILSGTLSYLFTTFDGTVPFSTLVRNAHRMGYTEPDPREDRPARRGPQAADSGASHRPADGSTTSRSAAWSSMSDRGSVLQQFFSVYAYDARYAAPQYARRAPSRDTSERSTRAPASGDFRRSPLATRCDSHRDHDDPARARRSCRAPGPARRTAMEFCRTS
jgi:hypothetical protein